MIWENFDPCILELNLDLVYLSLIVDLGGLVMLVRGPTFVLPTKRFATRALPRSLNVCGIYCAMTLLGMVLVEDNLVEVRLIEESAVF